MPVTGLPANSNRGLANHQPPFYYMDNYASPYASLRSQLQTDDPSSPGNALALLAREWAKWRLGRLNEMGTSSEESVPFDAGNMAGAIGKSGSLGELIKKAYSNFPYLFHGSARDAAKGTVEAPAAMRKVPMNVKQARYGFEPGTMSLTPDMILASGFARHEPNALYVGRARMHPDELAEVITPEGLDALTHLLKRSGLNELAAALYKRMGYGSPMDFLTENKGAARYLRQESARMLRENNIYGIIQNPSYEAEVAATGPNILYGAMRPIQKEFPWASRPQVIEAATNTRATKPLELFGNDMMDQRQVQADLRKIINSMDPNWVPTDQTPSDVGRHIVKELIRGNKGLESHWYYHAPQQFDDWNIP